MKLEGNLGGAILIATSGVFIAMESVLVRLASEDASNAQVVLFRAASQLTLVLAYLAGSRNWADLKTSRPGLMTLRGSTSLASWWFYYASVAALDLALATVLSFTTQLFVVAFAGLVLGETVTGRRRLATLVGFLGVVVATGAGTVRFEPGVWLGLASALIGAVTVFLNRGLTRTETTASISFFIGFVGTIGALPFALMDWKPLSWETTLLLVVAGAIGTLVNVLITEGYRRGEVSAMAPIPYLKIVWMTLGGWLVFAELPGPFTFVGAALVVGAGIALTWSEHAKTRRKT
jgi:drug/metabolite transporter (DMT)-like permease